MSSGVKRKLHALLETMRSASNDGTSSPAVAGDSNGTASPDPTMSHLEILAKRRRLDQTDVPTDSNARSPSIVSVPSPNQPKAPTTLANIKLRNWTPPNGKNLIPERGSTFAVSRSTSEASPRYCPGDRAQLIRRLATFQSLTDWTPKPDRVGELEWARRGWTCLGKERVRCALCNRELIVKLNRKEVEGKEVSVMVASEIAEALVERYVEMIVTSHHEDCLWRKRGCDGKSTFGDPAPTQTGLYAN
jgi:hypothetical protein